MRRRTNRTSTAGLLALALALLFPQTALGGRVEWLPDLRMAKLKELRLQSATTSDGPDRRLLRFTAIIVNVGDGPFVVKGRRDCASLVDCPRMTTQQKIQRSDGTWRTRGSVAPARYDVLDMHSHWHVMKVERFEVIPLGVPPEQAIQDVRGAKVGFCFFDTVAWRTDLPRASQNIVYRESHCGEPDSTSIRVGLSVGWGDQYPWFLPRQWVDTTGLPYGRYLLCATADGEGHWLEKRERNNQAWTELDLTFDDTDGDQVRDPGEAERIELLADGRSSCDARLPPPPGSTGTWYLDHPEPEALFWTPETRLICRIEDAAG